MENKRKINWELLGFIGSIVFVLICVCCGLASANLIHGGPGKCVSIAPFGKLEVMGIDKAVITVGGVSVTVTDANLLSRIVDETKVATHSYTCTHDNMKDRCIDLYRGDKLVRSMKWYECQDAVRVYDVDLTHWIFPELGAGVAEAGYAELSRELVKELNGLF